MRALLILLFLALFSHFGWSQCLPQPVLCNQNQCAFPNVNLTLSVDGNNEFCDGDTIHLEINESQSLDFDYLIYYWCDGNVDTITFQDQPGTHVYIVPDSLLCQSAESNYTIWVIGIKSCANGITCRSAATTLTVKNRPVANFNVQGEVCVNTSVPFSNASCNATTYLWNFGDGTTSTLQNPSHTYATPGNYTVSLTVTNTCGSDTQTRPVRVVAPPEAAFTHNPAFGCGPTTISFTDQANQWSNTVWSITP
ncbi:MAG TPA: PKD domain-containing protein, partial [Saprospiraceae bacterium]|nr:PKD domain-containing protein [Saprospiraceae bacterium]